MAGRETCDGQNVHQGMGDGCDGHTKPMFLFFFSPFFVSSRVLLLPKARSQVFFLGPVQRSGRRLGPSRSAGCKTSSRAPRAMNLFLDKNSAWNDIKSKYEATAQPRLQHDEHQQHADPKQGTCSDASRQPQPGDTPHTGRMDATATHITITIILLLATSRARECCWPFAERSRPPGEKGAHPNS